MHKIKVVDVVNKLWGGERGRNIEDKMMREHDVRSKRGRRRWYFREMKAAGDLRGEEWHAKRQWRTKQKRRIGRDCFIS